MLDAAQTQGAALRHTGTVPNRGLHRFRALAWPERPRIWSDEGSPVQPPPDRRTLRARNLAQQQTELTSEGSPPPGKVAIARPAIGDTGEEPIAAAHGAGTRAVRRPRFGRGR